jgi:multisubunit Na+/H+ antiporter MnhB subunit
LGLLGGAMLSATVVCYGVSWSRDSDRPEQFESFPEYRSWQDSVQGLALAGDVMVGLGGALVVAAIIWAAVERTRHRRERAHGDLND